MKYASTLPLTALIALSSILLLVNWQIIPDGLSILEQLNESFENYFYLMIFLIILLESIVYVGFYFPGQFFAVVLVILSKPDWWDILMLTVCMVAAATLGSAINYFLGAKFSDPEEKVKDTKLKHLLLAMIHMNSLAFFMFNQGAHRRRFAVVGLAGVFNLPYYLLLILVTATMSEKIMMLAENNWVLFGLLSIWLSIALIIDWRRYRQQRQYV